MSLSESTVKVLKASVPLLESHGLEITGRMYSKMMAEEPQLKGQFNMSHLVHVTNNNLGPDSSLQVNALCAVVLKLVHHHGVACIAMQAISLAQAVLAYAENCDNLGALGPAIESMAEKHAAFCVRLYTTI